MSASTEKKLRQAAREAGTDKKTLAQQEEAKKQAKSKRRWTIGTIAVVLLIAFILFLNSGFLYKHTTALTIGGEKYSPAEVNYYYGNEYLNFVNTYGSYASLFGLDTSAGLAGLRSQEYADGSTWRDYFRDMAADDMVETKALCDWAADNGIALDEEEIAEVDADFEGMGTYARALGYGNADALFAANYGSGVTQKIARESALASALANKAYTAKSDSIEYTADELEAYYQGLEGSYDVYSYDYYYVAAAIAEDADAPDETAMTEAKAEADAIVYAYRDGDEIEDVSERFAVAVESQTGEEPTESSRVAGSSLNAAYSDWLTNESRAAGDVTVIEDVDGYYVLLFREHDDNHYATASVRHILIMAEADENGEYTAEAKEAALAKAQDILSEFLAGDQSEESFAALAEEYSEDSGSNTNGGLYENVYKGQMVEEFDAFCFEGHKPGDTAIVYGESTSYAGYHVMYYVGEGDLYSDTIARNLMLSDDLADWMEELESGYEAVHGFGYRFVG